MSKAITEQSIKSHLNRSQRLQQLLAKAQEFSKLERKLQQLLPVNLQDKIRLAYLQEDTLILLSPNSSIANMMRFHQHGLCQLSGTRKLKIHIQPDAFPGPQALQHHNKKRHCPEAAGYIAASAKNIEDEELKAALLKLAGTLGE